MKGTQQQKSVIMITEIFLFIFWFLLLMLLELAKFLDDLLVTVAIRTYDKEMRPKQVKLIMSIAQTNALCGSFDPDEVLEQANSVITVEMDLLVIETIVIFSEHGAH